MNILVTGATGFIGDKVCRFLENKGHRIYKVARTCGDRSKGIIEVDLTNNNQVLQFCEQFKKQNSIDVVIHLASLMVNHLQDESEQFKVLASNIEITRNVVFIIRRLKIKKIINFSSMAVYPNVDGVFNENSKIMMSSNSECIYGLSKFCSENIFEYMLKIENVVVTNLRVAQVYGEGMREDRVISLMSSELKEKNTITVFGAGERVSNFIHIDKLIKAVRYFIIKDIAGVFNIGDESLSYLNLAQRIIDQYGNESSKIIMREEGSRAKFILDSAKIEKVIKDISELV